MLPFRGGTHFAPTQTSHAPRPFSTAPSIPGVTPPATDTGRPTACQAPFRETRSAERNPLTIPPPPAAEPPTLTPFTLHPSPFTVHLSPCTVHRSPFSLHITITTTRYTTHKVYARNRRLHIAAGTCVIFSKLVASPARDESLNDNTTKTTEDTTDSVSIITA